MKFKNYRLCIFSLLFSHVLTASEIDPYEVRALLEPAREAVISSELSARIAGINIREGDHIRKNDVLIRFNCTLYRAQLDEALADLGAAKIQLANKQKLLKLRSAGKLDVELAQYNVAGMAARVTSAEEMTRRCTISAPFNGRVVEVVVNEHETIDSGKNLLWILDNSTLEVSLVLPSAWLLWLKPDHRFDLSVDETGMTYQGKIKGIGSKVDAVSQSVRVTGILDHQAGELMSGMSGTAVFTGRNSEITD